MLATNTPYAETQRHATSLGEKSAVGLCLRVDLRQAQFRRGFKARECTPSRMGRRSPSRNVGECYSQGFCWLVVAIPPYSNEVVWLIHHYDTVFVDLAVISETAKSLRQ